VFTASDGNALTLFARLQEGHLACGKPAVQMPEIFSEDLA